jgi:hypothetical protein
MSFGAGPQADKDADTQGSRGPESMHLVLTTCAFRCIRVG